MPFKNSISVPLFDPLSSQAYYLFMQRQLVVYAYSDLFKYQVWQKSGPTSEAKARSNWSPMMMRKVMQVPAKKSKQKIFKHNYPFRP